MRHVPVATTLRAGYDHVTALEQLRGPVTVIRRCESLAELVSVARTGLCEAVLVAGQVEELTLSFLETLQAGTHRPVAVVAWADVPSERRRLAGLGLPVVSEETDAQTLAETIIDAVAKTRAAGTAQWNHREYPELVATDQEIDQLEDLWHEQAPARPAAQRSTAAQGSTRSSGSAQTSATAVSASADPVPSDLREDQQGDDIDTASPETDSEEAGPRAETEDAAPATRPARSWRGLLSRRSGKRGATADAIAARDEPAPPRVTTVWGPAGSPGRTTIAVNLAVELALSGRSTVLVDLDTYAASVAIHLGLLEETAGVARACHGADQGNLTITGLRRIAATARVAGGSVDVLSGLTRTERWPEVRRQAVETVLEIAREGWDEVVVDVGFSLEQDEELSFDVPAPQRNAATLAGLEAADRIFAVGTGDAVGLPRLIRGLDELDELGLSAPVEVLVNQVRSDSSGAAPQSQVRAVWDRYGPDRQIAGFLPWDRKGLDRALLSGQVLAEAAPNSALRRGLATWVNPS